MLVCFSLFYNNLFIIFIRRFSVSIFFLILINLLGAPPEALKLPIFTLLMGNKIVAGMIFYIILFPELFNKNTYLGLGSNIGGIKQTQEMLDFCEEKNIVADIELIKAEYIDTAYDRVVRSDVKYRFVIDIDSMRS